MNIYHPSIYFLFFIECLQQLIRVYIVCFLVSHAHQDAVRL